jgi:hypothetical protein
MVPVSGKRCVREREEECHHKQQRIERFDLFGPLLFIMITVFCLLLPQRPALM